MCFSGLLIVLLFFFGYMIGKSHLMFHLFFLILFVAFIEIYLFIYDDVLVVEGLIGVTTFLLSINPKTKIDFIVVNIEFII